MYTILFLDLSVVGFYQYDSKYFSLNKIVLYSINKTKLNSAQLYIGSRRIITWQKLQKCQVNEGKVNQID